jgi:hypothetical protein
VNIKKLFFVIHHYPVDRIDVNYKQYLDSQLRQQFSAKGIEIYLHFIDPEMVRNAEYKKQIEVYFNDFKSDAMVEIMIGGGQDSAYGGIFEIHYDISLYNQWAGKRIWRAMLYVGGGSKVYEKKMTIMAQKLVDRLSTDDLI